jgi:hypothetical protein
MAVTVLPDVIPGLRSQPSYFVRLEIMSGRDADLVASATRAAARELTGAAPRNAPVSVIGPCPIPGGCLLIADFDVDTGRDTLARVPAVLARHLEAASIADAVIRLARRAGDDRYETPRSFGPAAKAWLVGPQPVGGSGIFPRLEPLLAGAGTRWIREQLWPQAQLAAMIAGTEVLVDPDGADVIVEGRRHAPAGEPEYNVSLVATDFTGSAAGAFFGDLLGTAVTLSAAGANWTADQVVTRMLAQRDIIRSHADAAVLEWAGVTASYDNGELLTGDQIGMDYQSGMEHQLLGLVWYQVLSEGQLRRAGGPPLGAVRLPGGRFELTVGDASQWMPGSPARSIVEEQASRLLPGS